MARKVVFRDEADAELNALYDYIAGQGSPDTAIGYVRRIRTACLALAHFPERGTSVTTSCQVCAQSVSNAGRQSHSVF